MPSIPTELILEKLQKTYEQKKYSFPTEYGVDNPKLGFDQRRYFEEKTPQSKEERWKSYFTS